jgi:glycerol uptake facilitator-like aquaporin
MDIELVAGGTEWVRRAVAEFLGTAMLLIAVVGSGTAAQRLSPADVGLELLENALATGAALVAIILAFGPISGAHLNPVVTVAEALTGRTAWREVPSYVGAQLCGGAFGTVLANLMFGLAAVSMSSHVRSWSGLWLGELVATFGLIVVVKSCRPAVAPFAVGAYITGAYWFTSSTSFANPAVTLARMLSDTFAGIAPGSVPMFILMQLAGGALGVAATGLLYPAHNVRHHSKEVQACLPEFSSPST